MKLWRRGVLAAAAGGLLVTGVIAPPAASAAAPEGTAAVAAARATNKAIDVRRMIDLSLRDAQNTNLKKKFDVPSTWKVSRVTVAEADGAVATSDGALKPKDFRTWLIGIAVVFRDGQDVVAVYTVAYRWRDGQLKKRQYLPDPIFEDLWMDQAPTHNLSWAMKAAQAFMADNPDLYPGVVPVYNAVVRNPLGWTETKDYQWIFGTINNDGVQAFLLVNDTTGEITYEAE